MSSWIDLLRSVDTPTLSNAIELLGVRPRSEGFTPLGLRCLFPELAPLCGHAVTAQVETISETEPFDVGRFVELYEALDATPRPGVIAFQEIGPRSDFAAHCGEVMGTIFNRLGAAGLVTDSAVRDVPEVRRLGFQYFARGMVASHASFRIVRVGVPVQIEGLVIRPGDILHGDENGLLSIPPGIEGELPANVDEVRARERALLDYVRGPDFTVEGLRTRMAE
jgi:regulator of RNase E activity RraA